MIQILLKEWSNHKLESTLGRWLFVIWYGCLAFAVSYAMHYWLFSGGLGDDVYQNLIETHQRVISGIDLAPLQYRILSYLTPELLHRFLGITVSQAYGLFRWGALWLAALGYHVYLRIWFDWRYAFLGTLFMFVMLPYYMLGHDLLPSDFPAFFFIVVGFYLLATNRTALLILILPIATLYRETTLYILVAWALEVTISRSPKKELGRFFVGTLVTVVAFVGIRTYYGYREYWIDLFMLPSNLANPMSYVGTLLSFNLFWLFAALGYRHSPVFLKRTAWLLPTVAASVWLIGRPLEVRLWLPLMPVIIPLGLMFFQVKPSSTA